MRVSNNFVGQPLFFMAYKLPNHRKALRFVPKCLQARCMRLQWRYSMGLVRQPFCSYGKEVKCRYKTPQITH